MCHKRFRVKCPKCGVSCYEFRNGLPCIGGYRGKWMRDRKVAKGMGVL
jgi:hypothetical protein